MAHASDDELWGEEEHDRGHLQREWATRRSEFWNSGYRDGIEAGKQETVQEGFNEGKRSRACRAAGRPCLDLQASHRCCDALKRAQDMLWAPRLARPGEQPAARRRRWRRWRRSRPGHPAWRSTQQQCRQSTNTSPACPWLKLQWQYADTLLLRTLPAQLPMAAARRQPTPSTHPLPVMCSTATCRQPQPRLMACCSASACNQ